MNLRRRSSSHFWVVGRWLGRPVRVHSSRRFSDRIQAVKLQTRPQTCFIEGHADQELMSTSRFWSTLQNLTCPHCTATWQASPTRSSDILVCSFRLLR